MLFINKKALDEYIDARVKDVLANSAAYQLREGNYYILVVPEDVDADQLKRSFEPLRKSDINLAVVVANGVSLLELGNVDK